MKILALFVLMAVLCTSCTMGFKGSFAYGYDGSIKQATVVDEEDNR